jgi:rRNA (uridine-N3-)-methyltransferase BTM5-like
MVKKQRRKQHKVWRERKQRRDQHKLSSLTHLPPTSVQKSSAQQLAAERTGASSTAPGKRGRGGGCASGRLWVANYTSRQSVLVLGDGDFSFARGLVQHRGSGRLLVLTAYDSRSLVTSKYAVGTERIERGRLVCSRACSFLFLCVGTLSPSLLSNS